MTRTTTPGDMWKNCRFLLALQYHWRSFNSGEGIPGWRSFITTEGSLLILKVQLWRTESDTNFQESHISEQPLNSLSWSPDKTGLALTTSLDQKVRVVIVTRLASVYWGLFTLQKEIVTRLTSVYWGLFTLQEKECVISARETGQEKA